MHQKVHSHRSLHIHSDNACACLLRVGPCRRGSMLGTISDPFWGPGSLLSSLVGAHVCVSTYLRAKSAQSCACTPPRPTTSPTCVYSHGFCHGHAQSNFHFSGHRTRKAQCIPTGGPVKPPFVASWWPPPCRFIPHGPVRAQLPRGASGTKKITHRLQDFTLRRRVKKWMPQGPPNEPKSLQIEHRLRQRVRNWKQKAHK